MKMLLAIPKLRKKIRSADIVYAMSPDLTALAMLAGLGLQKRYVMDMADIRRVQVSKNPIGFAWRLIDRWVIKRVHLLVVTARGFVTDYYEKYLRCEVRNFFVLENKVDYAISSRPSRPLKACDKIKIGYFGVLRSNWSFEVLLRLLTDYPSEFEINVAGINFQSEYDLHELERRYDGFTYWGTYNSPEDLSGIYANIDYVFACNPDPQELDPLWYWMQKICRVNRYYEAIFFQKPLIVRDDSADGMEVRINAIGISIASDTPSDAASEIRKNAAEKLDQYHKNIEKLPVQSFHSDEDLVEFAEKLGGLSKLVI